jgi:hypothetical protein
MLTLDPDTKNNNNKKDIIRNIPIFPALANIIFKIVQTQDVFHLGFYPDNNHLDIDIHEFLDYRDVYYQIKDRLQELSIDPSIQYLILLNIGKQSKTIQDNINYFGVPHIFD